MCLEFSAAVYLLYAHVKSDKVNVLSWVCVKEPKSVKYIGKQGRQPVKGEKFSLKRI